MTCGADADGQVVWSWRPWAGAKFAGDDLASDGDYEVTDTGEITKQPLTPSRRECRLFGFACSDYACVLLHFAHKAAGAVKHPAFPAPSAFEGCQYCMTRTHRVAGTRSHAFHRHCERSEAIQKVMPGRKSGLLRRFAPRNDGEACCLKFE